MIDKTREYRLRHKAKRCGFKLVKCPRRDPDAADFGLYALFSLATGEAVNPPSVVSIHGWNLDQIEDHLERPKRLQGKPEQRAAR